MGGVDNQGGLDGQDISETKVPEACINSTRSSLLSSITSYKEDHKYGSHLRDELGNQFVEMLNTINTNPNAPNITEIHRRVDKTLLDYEYARQYWIENRHLIPFGKFSIIMKHIAGSLPKGEIHFFVNPSGLDEGDKKMIGAYRTLARQMGYAVGDSTRKVDTITIPIKFVQSIQS